MFLVGLNNTTSVRGDRAAPGNPSGTPASEEAGGPRRLGVDGTVTLQPLDLDLTASLRTHTAVAGCGCGCVRSRLQR
ncbi:hypothetical protein EYF80_013268 [Liparis tanakae]|uniref:Uncharacterized protein n=1 Tax=Liparis tanakae TaxID=230148 RepID=A0A4Z2IGW6_9TELE|nr:hypothetical protein EYF80_013268 [Liparis tanakae]